MKDKVKTKNKKHNKLFYSLFVLSAVTTAGMILSICLPNMINKDDMSKVDNEFYKSVAEYKLAKDDINLD